MSKTTIVLGAGMVGVSVAWHLARRGREVLLLDRREPGLETSFGNAGIIQREAFAPYAFPRDLKTILTVLPNRRVDIRYRATGMVQAAGPLFQYWVNSTPQRYRRIVPEYASIIAMSTDEHGPMIESAGAGDLVQKAGWLQLFRTQAGMQDGLAHAEESTAYGVQWQALDRTALDAVQPGLSPSVIGAIHWQNSWTVAAPGELVSRYARDSGASFQQASVQSLHQQESGWQVQTDQGAFEAEAVVVALGPWSQKHLAPLGYDFPLFVKRGYHMHYHQPEPQRLKYWIMDTETGYLLEPMTGGIRLTTGAELAGLEAPPMYKQLEAAEKAAREVFAIGQRADATPWKGARPCLPDMKPIIGPAHKHKGLWLAMGHGHQGFTLGPPTGRLLAEQMDGEATAIDVRPFRADRFG
ncbi:MAG: NAD(P)/FAD-dependent oxidoreductase [Saccharospirillum sp.]